jgi:hypothetical protein
MYYIDVLGPGVEIIKNIKLDYIILDSYGIYFLNESENFDYYACVPRERLHVFLQQCYSDHALRLV